MMHVHSFLSVMLVGAALAACGGSSKSPATPTPTPGAPTTSDNDPATPFDDAAAKEAIANTPQSSAPACGDGDDINATLGDLFRARGADLAPADETFECRPHLSEEGSWECTWSVFAKPPENPDPEFDGATSGFQIIVNVGADGVLEQESFVCVAPG